MSAYRFMDRNAADDYAVHLNGSIERAGLRGVYRAFADPLPGSLDGKREYGVRLEHRLNSGANHWLDQGFITRLLEEV
ncbi:MAG: hypothetical protein Q8P46_06850 [Hyphomicrobiales bacterium]|nr:hypothetical protein [Hyphomicrobiales bacterium]